MHTQDTPSRFGMEHEAVERLFELACEGKTANSEFVQLDALVYARLSHTYGLPHEVVHTA